MEIQMDQLQAWFHMVAYLIDRGRIGFHPNKPTVILPSCPKQNGINSIGRIDSFINFNPNKRSPANFSILYHT